MAFEQPKVDITLLNIDLFKQPFATSQHFNNLNLRYQETEILLLSLQESSCDVTSKIISSSDKLADGVVQSDRISFVSLHFTYPQVE